MKTQATTQEQTIESINVKHLEWFDKINGNTYFACKVTLNNKESFTLPFQYGYGSQFEVEILDKLKTLNLVSFEGNSLTRFCKENNVNLIIKTTQAKKAELKNI